MFYRAPVRQFLVTFLLLSLLLIGNPCTGQDKDLQRATYAPVQLTADISHLSENQKQMLILLMEAGQQMDRVFWRQAYGNKKQLMEKISDPTLRRFAEINYGPWDRLNENAPFVDGVGPKPPGANLYPKKLTKKRFEKFLEDNPQEADAFKSLYTVIAWDSETKKLQAIPYHERFEGEFVVAAQKLLRASRLSENEGFKRYLVARAGALLTGEYRASDMLWMDMKTNPIDCVIGPIETYEDQLNGYKAACECYVLLKDMSWSQRLSKYAGMLPELQKGLPVPEKYKQESPGSKSDLNAYDVVFYQGDCNAGSKTIAINLPNDEVVQLAKGSRRLQLKNAMRAKFDKILVPIADLLIVPEQRSHVTFDAFFSNTMFHEVAHGLGIKETITGNGSVRSALRESASALEEGKADVLGLYMVTTLLDQYELEGQIEDFYITFMTSIFRSVRFGASSAHGKANMIRFNFFKERNAFTRDEDTGKYKVNMPEMKVAMTELSRKILMLQGEGDYDAARSFADEMGFIGPVLRADLERVNRAGIPTDIVFEQGPEVLGLSRKQ